MEKNKRKEGTQANPIALLSTYRTQLMGIATLMIIICHTHATVELPHIISKIFNYGNLGVDIFLLLSGIGCYYSLRKHKDKFAFWHRRITRLLIPYLLITLPFAIFALAVGQENILDFVWRMTAMEFWLYHKGAWFVSLMIPLYLISPFLFHKMHITNKSRGGWNIAIVILISVLFTILSYHRLLDNGQETVISNIQMAIFRTPSFLIGIAIAPYCKVKNTKIEQIFIAMAIAYLTLRIFKVSIPWLITPILSIALAMFCKYIHEKGFIFKLLTIIGGISLESYLYNIYLGNPINYFLQPYKPLSEGFQITEYLVIAFGGLMLAYYSRKYISILINKYEKL